MKKIVLLSCLLSMTYALTAQNAGLLFNPATYQKFVDGYDARQSSRGGRSSSGRLFPQFYSLKPYCPKAGRQGNASCVGWAIGYGAMTILRAKQLGITNPDEVTQLAHSASYIYNQIATSDASGAYPDTAFRLLKRQGVCRNETFGSNLQFHGKPTEKAHQEAKRFQIADFDIVFKPDTSERAQLEAIKQKLLENTPPILCVATSQAFRQKGQYKPDPNADTVAHALCLIGFDDRDSTFEVFNSWGETWGNQGFKKLNQRDVLRMILGIYWMKLPPVRTHWRTSEIIFKRAMQQNQQKTLDEVEMKYDASSFPYYKTRKTAFDEKTVFEMTLRELYAEQHVYIFGRDPNAQWIHYQTVTTERNLVEATNRYEFTQKGTELVLVLFSTTEITDYQQRFKQMKSAKGSPQQNIEMAFGDLLATKQSVEYLPYRVGISYPKAQAAIVGFSLEAD